jgi:cytochrome P450
MLEPDHPYNAIFDPEYWGRHGAPHDLLSTLRKNDPVYWFENDRFDPAWLLTRHKDIEFVSKRPDLFLSGPRTVFHNPQGFKSPLIGLPQQDAPQHTKHRRAMQGWFTPKAIRGLEARMAEIAKDTIDRMAATASCEFCDLVSSKLPLKMICEILGIPEAEEPVVWQLTQDVFAASDRDLGKAASAQEGVRNAMAFCADIARDRQANPTDDFASTIANAEIDGERMSIQEIASHLMIMISAGHDTTASAISGGMLALIRNPEQLARLKEHPELTESAVNEMLRYVTPTTNFVRTAAEDTEIGGVAIAKGQDVCIHFCAANRDEEEFDNPHAFVIDRRPNRHLAFGIGPHACIGQLLARIEMKALFEELMPRIERIELDAEPENIKAFWVSGLKKLPINYNMKASD